MKWFGFIRKEITEKKIFIKRSMSYISILNSGMILFLLLSRLEDYGYDIVLEKWFFPIYIFGVLGMIIVGYLDYKLGFHSEEQKVMGKRNPYMKEIIDRLDSIERKIKK